VAGRTLNLLPARAGDRSAALASHVFLYLFSRTNSVADVVALSFLGGHPSKKNFLVATAGWWNKTRHTKTPAKARLLAACIYLPVCCKLNEKATNKANGVNYN